ncbi:CueP family metal-binding protein [Thalassiella azotivora]
MLRRAHALVAVPLLLVAACGGAADDDPSDPADRSGRSASAAASLLAEHGLDVLADADAAEVVDHLERLSGPDRPSDLMASVRPDELLLSDAEDEVSLPMPDDRFYVSVAPYVDGTHDCFFHSLTTCQGEMVEEDVRVVVTSTEGEVLLDEQRTTVGNGFVGLWLPRGVEGTLEVTAGELSGEVPVGTGPDDPTCVTTLQLA